MEEHGAHDPTSQDAVLAPEPFVGIHDLLPAGGDVPLDLAALMPSGTFAVVGPVGARSTRDVALGAGASTLHLFRGSQLRVGRPLRLAKPDFSPGFAPSLDLRRPLSRKAVAAALDVRFRRHFPTRKRMDLVPPVRTLAGEARKRVRRFAESAGDLAPSVAAWSGVLAAGAVVLVGGLLLAKGTVESDLASGYGRLAALAHGEAGDLSKAVGDVRFSFRRATLLFGPVSLLADNPLYRNGKVQLADHAIAGGREIADALAGLEQAYVRARRDLSAAGGWKNVAWTALLSRERPALSDAVGHLSSALAHYEAMDPAQLPDPAVARKFVEARDALRDAVKWGNFVLDNWKLEMDALGDSYPVKILVLNQNRDELRAGGGFPGSVGVIDLYRGKVTGFDNKDVYWFDWRLYPYKEPAPEGINRLYNNDGTPVSFGLRDANYFPSFLESARKVDFFFQKAGQGSLDAVVGINQGMVVDLLKITGPVYLPEIGRSIGADDFSLAMSLLVEARMYAKASPKDILFRFGEEFAKRMEEQASWGAYAKVVAKHLADGDVPMAWLRPEIQKGLVDAVRPSDRWKYDAGDWAYPVFTSYSGNKSDRAMDRTITLAADPKDPCRRTFSLEARHTFSAADEASVRKWMYDLGILRAGKDVERLVRIQGAGDNDQYVRLVLPAGSRLVSGDGAAVRQSQDHPKYSVIDWYQETKPGATTRVNVTYSVPAALCGKAPTLYRQPGLVAEMSIR